MKYRIFGKSASEVSEIGFGAWAIGGSWGEQSDKDSLEALGTALENGVNFIDTAAGYGDGKSERIIGEFLKSRSEKVQVSTKTPPAPGKWPPSPYCKIEERYSEKYLRENVEERLKSEGIIKQIGISTPEHDQNCVIQLMRDGMVDVLQVIYNIFEQEPAAQLLPVALETGTGIIVRVAFDEGVLTGKYRGNESFGPGDFRSNYFAGDRLERGVRRTEKIKKEFGESGYSMPQLALKFAMSHEAVSTVIPGIRNRNQALQNTAVSDLPELSNEILQKLREHSWNRGFWYGGK